MKRFLFLNLFLLSSYAQAEIHRNFLGEFGAENSTSDSECPKKITVELSGRGTVLNARAEGQKFLSLELNNNQGYNEDRSSYVWNTKTNFPISGYQFYGNSLGEMHYTHNSDGKVTKVERNHFHMFGRDYHDGLKHNVYVQIVTGYYSIPYSENDTSKQCRYSKSLTQDL